VLLHLAASAISASVSRYEGADGTSIACVVLFTTLLNVVGPVKIGADSAAVRQTLDIEGGFRTVPSIVRFRLRRRIVVKQ
jgi:hypothetical protein